MNDVCLMRSDWLYGFADSYVKELYDLRFFA